MINKDTQTYYGTNETPLMTIVMMVMKMMMRTVLEIPMRHWGRLRIQKILKTRMHPLYEKLIFFIKNLVRFVLRSST